ncbi:transporter substrate-binding domain-containing protein [Bifidobacterium pseudocatenulatum]|uniref:transporter substrate-binding domain-containing protein n=1 Tax=Bifidobacterium pseudocatenulatum TaxID=28026 RepID=UPI003B9ABFD0
MERCSGCQYCRCDREKPYTFVDGNNYTGYDFELLKKIDEKLPQYKFKYTALAQDALLTGLQSGEYDAATCSFYGTAERFKTFDYSENPTGLSDARLIIRSDEKNINSLEDLAKSGKKLAPIPTDDARYTLINQYNEKHPNNKIEFEGATENPPRSLMCLKPSVLANMTRRSTLTRLSKALKMNSALI